MITVGKKCWHTAVVSFSWQYFYENKWYIGEICFHKQVTAKEMCKVAIFNIKIQEWKKNIDNSNF